MSGIQRNINIQSETSLDLELLENTISEKNWVSCKVIFRSTLRNLENKEYHHYEVRIEDSDFSMDIYSSKIEFYLSSESSLDEDLAEEIWETVEDFFK